ncbi:Uncharacterised protein [Vibrio cholerae]|uniref:Uncharacterized protein n=1 Tax=Vibrio cholerae TaxID=666 RepID=A0A655RP70_VIBCL|nr:Uncharacterised protein [Vibrio cholerae]CSB94707.1 Uncharacterised protein [Vibrio cholerae]
MQQYKAAELVFHLLGVKGVFLKLFTGHAPIRVEIEHHRFALCFSLCQCALQLAQVSDASKLDLFDLLSGLSRCQPVIKQGLRRSQQS